MESNFLQTLREASRLEEILEELCELKKKAFEVFESWTSLEEIGKIFETYWKDLSHWNDEHPDSPQFYMQKHREMEGIFKQVTRAEINRTEFADLLADSRNEVENCIAEIEKRLSKKQEELAELYDAFAKTTGAFRFIFEEPNIRLLIMDKLLKPQIEEESN